MDPIVLRVSAGRSLLALVAVAVIWSLTIWATWATLELRAAKSRMVVLEESLDLHRQYAAKLEQYGLAHRRMYHACGSTLINLMDRLGMKSGAVTELVKAWQEHRATGGPDGM